MLFYIICKINIMQYVGKSISIFKPKKKNTLYWKSTIFYIKIIQQDGLIILVRKLFLNTISYIKNINIDWDNAGAN